MTRLSFLIVLLRWYLENNLGMFGVNQRSLLQTYFLAAATLVEPEKSNVRLAWAKTIALVQAFELYFRKEKASFAVRRDFLISEFHHSYTCQSYKRNKQRYNYYLSSF